MVTLHAACQRTVSEWRARSCLSEGRLLFGRPQTPVLVAPFSCETGGRERHRVWGEHLRRRSPFGLVRHSKPRRSYAPLVNNLSGADEFAHTHGVLWLDRQFGRLSRGFWRGFRRGSTATKNGRFGLLNH